MDFRSFVGAGKLGAMLSVSGDSEATPEIAKKAFGAVMLATGGAMVVLGHFPGAQQIRNAGDALVSKGMNMLKTNKGQDTKSEAARVGQRTTRAINAYARRTL